MHNILFTTLLALFFLQGCIKYEEDPLCEDFTYISFEEFRSSVEVLEPQEINLAGKIYVYEDLLLISEPYKGVHIIDNSDKSNPVPLAFVKVLGNVDIAVKDGYMYVDSYMDLVVVDINNLDDIKEIKRSEDIFVYNPYQASNPYYYFNLEKECGYNTDEGVVIGATQ